MNDKEKKAELRTAILAKRNALSSVDKELIDTQLCNQMLSVIRSKDVHVIHTYLPFGSEIDIRPLINSLLEDDYTLVCPKSLPKGKMENLVLKSLNELEEGRFGIKHPAGGIVYTGNIDFFIVPGIAFDDRNYRLGYGAGYYDRFFALHPAGYKVGLCYPFQRIDTLPVESFDIPLDRVIF